MPPTIGETLRVWLLSALVVHGAVAGNPDAKRLYDDLLSNYNKLVRPVVNTSDVLRVCIKLKLSQLIDVVSTILLSAAPLWYSQEYFIASDTKMRGTLLFFLEVSSNFANDASLLLQLSNNNCKDIFKYGL